MNRALLFCTLVAAALTIQSAKADDFTIAFDGGPLGYSGSGVFVGTETSTGVYDITGVLSGSVTDPGFGTSNIVSVSTALGSDNMLFFPDPGTGFFDGNGLSFTLANGIDVNLWDFSPDSGITYLDASIDDDPNGGVPQFVTDTVTPFTPLPPPVPEPSSIVFMGTAALLGAADFLRRRRLQA
jgi:hypothetical protein